MSFFFFELAKSKEAAVNQLLQLSGRLQLVTAQIDRATNCKSHTLTHDEHQNESEDEDEDVDEVVYGVDEESEIDSDNDD